MWSVRALIQMYFTVMGKISLTYLKDYLLVNGEKTAMCGSLSSPRTMIFPARMAESIFQYTDSTYIDKVRSPSHTP